MAANHERIKELEQLIRDTNQQIDDLSKSLAPVYDDPVVVSNDPE